MSADGTRNEDAPRPRRRRRATGGVPSSDVPDALLPGRAADDADVGWGRDGSDSRGPADPDDERLLREVPPHW